MALPHGGHLTHGTKVSFSGKWFNAVQYGVRQDTEDIDYDQVRDLAREHRPKMIIAGGSAIPRLIDFAAFRDIADEVGAIFMVDAAHFIGLVAGKAIPSPVPYADVVTFTTHKVLRGPRGGAIVCKAEHAKAIDKAVFPMMQGGPLMHTIAAKAVNLKECLHAGVPGLRAPGHRQRPGAHRRTGRRGAPPGHRRHRHPPGAARPAESASPARTPRPLRRRRDRAEQERDPVRPAAADDRVGHPGRQPAVTTQGMTEGEMKSIASLIGTAIRDADGSRTAEVAAGVRELVAAHPAYPEPARPRARRLIRCASTPSSSSPPRWSPSWPPRWCGWSPSARG